MIVNKSIDYFVIILFRGNMIGIMHLGKLFVANEMSFCLAYGPNLVKLKFIILLLDFCTHAMRVRCRYK